MKDTIRKILILIIVALNVGCDQLTKSMVRQHVEYNANIKIISDNITLTKVENSGAFLSAGDTLNAPIKFVLLLLMPIATLLFGLYFVLYKRHLDKLLMIGICCVIGGGAGNLYDRVIYGSVTDFVHIDFILFQTGVFNAADVSIIVGMLMIVISSYRKRTDQNLSKVL